jgi:hypothetical protein
MSSMDSTLRPMSTGQVLDRTFHLYRNNFLLFAGISAVPPAVLLVWQASFFLLALIPFSGGNVVASETLLILGIIALLVAYLVAFSLATGATVYAVSRVHLGHAVRIGESYRMIRPLVWKIVGIVVSVAIRFIGASGVAVAAGVMPVSLMVAFRPSLDPTALMIVIWGGGLLVVVAVIVCVIWAIRLYCSYQLAVPACVLERRGVLDCLKRSRFLSKGKTVQRILLVLFLSGILTYVLSLVLELPAFILTMIGALNKTPALAISTAIWQYLSGFAAGTIAGPIATIALALLYYDERVRKEAFDLQLMMEAMGQANPAQAAAATAPGAIG